MPPLNAAPSSFSLLCDGCGAPLKWPDDEPQTTIRCPYCGRTIVKSAERKVTHEKTDRPPSRSSPWPTIVALLVIFFGVWSIVVFSRTQAPKQLPTYRTPTRNFQVASSPSIEAISTHESPGFGEPPIHSASLKIASLLKEHQQRGCKKIVLPISQSSGEQNIESQFVRNGWCVSIILISDSTNNPLTLSMKTPRGERINTPPQSPEILFTYCPKISGLHPTVVTPKTNSPYYVTAIECEATGKKP